MKLFNKVWMLGFASLVGLTLTGCGSSSKIELKKEIFTVEYGEIVSTNAKDYLVKDTEKDVLNKTKVVIKDLKNEKDKDYAKVGEYKATAEYNDESKPFTIKVEDTTAPVFKDLKKEIKVEQNAEAVDFTKYFEAEDLSNVKITVNDKKVDLSRTGEYDLKVTAKDKYENKTTEKVKIIVVAADKANEVTETIDGEKPLSTETKQKKEEQAKSEQEQANTGGNTNTSGGSSGGSTNGGSSSNNSGNNSSSGGNNNNSTNNGGTNPTPSAPYIVDDGRSYKYNPNTLIDISMQSPLFNTDDEAFAWAYASSYWTTNRYGFETVSVIFSDGSEKVSVSWYN